MKFLFDFFPVLLFFIIFNTYDDHLEGIIAATKAMIAASVLQIVLYWFKNRRFEKMHLVTLAIVVIFGGATIILRDPVFIKWKPTIANWLFGLAFLGSQFIGKKSIIRRMMDQSIQLPDPVWLRLNIFWVSFFCAMGFINLYVAFTYPLDTWVSFKTYGLLGLTLAFVIFQGFYLAQYMKELPAEIKTDEADK